MVTDARLDAVFCLLFFFFSLLRHGRGADGTHPRPVNSPTSAPNTGAQRLRTILVVPNNAVTCIHPITSGIPNSLKYRGRRFVMALCDGALSWPSCPSAIGPLYPSTAFYNPSARQGEGDYP